MKQSEQLLLNTSLQSEKVPKGVDFGVKWWVTHNSTKCHWPFPKPSQVVFMLNLTKVPFHVQHVARAEGFLVCLEETLTGAYVTK